MTRTWSLWPAVFAALMGCNGSDEVNNNIPQTGVAPPVQKIGNLTVYIPSGNPDAVKAKLDALRSALTNGLELQNEDYAQARREFKTKLVHSGPSPQPGKEIQIPPGAREIVYQSGDLKLKAFVSPPPAGGGKRPAVLFLHGGFAFGGDDWEMPQPYRDAGYVVMDPILRGENGQAGSFTLYYDEVDDVLAAADVLAKLPYVDASRIYVAGHSAGGTLTLLAAMASKGFRAAAALSGCPDQRIAAQLQPYLVSFDQSDPREFQLRSPMAYATSFKCAVRMYSGDQEGFIRSMCERTAVLASDKGLDVQAVTVSGDHLSSVPEAIKRSIAFFQEK